MSKAAFPVLELINGNGQTVLEAEPGMSLREYFAAAALRGYLASYANREKLPSPDNAAREALRYADALCSALTGDTK